MQITEEDRRIAASIAAAHPLDGGAAHPIFDSAQRAFTAEFGEAANRPEGMNCYVVRVIKAGVVENQFEAMSTDAATCVSQHLHLAGAGKLDVMTKAAWDDKVRAEWYARQEVEQLRREGRLA